MTRNRTGHLILGLGILAFACISQFGAPLDYQDSCYLLVLEYGGGLSQEWVHPLWLFVLTVFRTVISLFGWHGNLLVAVEEFSIGLACLAILILYVLARRVVADPIACAAGALVIAGVDSFWRQAAMSGKPYAACFCCVAAALSLLVSGEAICPRRYAGAAVLSGLATGLHLSAVALVPVGLVCVWWERRRYGAPVSPRMVAFVRTYLATVGCCYAVFLYRNPTFFAGMSFSALLANAEQVRGLRSTRPIASFPSFSGGATTSKEKGTASCSVPS